MTSTIPTAALTDNPLAIAIETGRVRPNDLAPLACHLDELVGSNVSSTELMARRHQNTPLASLYELSHQSEQHAYQLLSSFVGVYDTGSNPTRSMDAVALAYPGQIARIAVTGSPWDYPASFVHLCRSSTGCYRRLYESLLATEFFTTQQLAHFDYFSQIDEAEITATESLLTGIPDAALARALQLAQQLASFEELFWQRMVALCTA
ncbi:hypothetical protein [Rhodococcus sp. IEGM 1330]|uniref:hypothetical protein n=1 Tax=Rhodococcus sp. IEGM 1330 TaxID=3082225 RepID=UPI0029549745|nr:hypothetical protein [Rhodococcus sp. IEGM 1330]MDV8022657.1 hypothetical protein [Rhodococcus sp. IEGM 1330]